MKNLILFAIAIFIGTLNLNAQDVATPPQTSPYENYIQVTGYAEREIVPDEIYVDITVSEENMKSKESLEKKERDMIAKLKSIGVDTDKDLKIADMASNYKDYLFSKNNPKTSAKYQLKVGSSVMLGKVYQVMEQIGISDMNISKVSHSKINQFRAEIRKEAMTNAKQVASELAEAVGQKAGRAILITDYNRVASNDYAMVSDVVMLRSSKAATDAPYETSLSFRNITINYSVSVKFALE
jgi:uncharacterized protein YggE